MSEIPIIQTDYLKRRFGATVAVENLSLKVHRGKCFGFFGRNGAGKTTTIMCLLNILRPGSGTVRLFGMDPAVEEIAVKIACVAPAVTVISLSGSQS